MKCDHFHVKYYSFVTMIFQSQGISMVAGTHKLKYCTTIFFFLALSSIVLAEEGGTDCPNDQPAALRTDDEVWLLSCRGLDCVEQGGIVNAEQLTQGLTAWRFDLSGKTWERAELDPLRKTTPSPQTVVWVHGNLTTASEAFSDGLTLYRRLVNHSEIQTPIRFIIWSWPASKILTRPVPDARIKAARTTSAGFRLAGVLQSLPPESEVSLIGFSFGARVVSATMELLAGGKLNSTSLDLRSDFDSDGYRVTLFAAALDSTWLLPDHRFGMALQVVNHLTLINNYCDRILKHYGKLYCHCARQGPSALGYTGLPDSNLPTDERDTIEQFNASGSIGKQHAWRPYVESSTTMELIRSGTFGK